MQGPLCVMSRRARHKHRNRLKRRGNPAAALRVRPWDFGWRQGFSLQERGLVARALLQSFRKTSYETGFSR